MGLSMGCVCGKDSVSVQNHRYTVKHRLGDGGFSVIDLVHDSKSHKDYALKRIVCHSELDEASAIREAEYMMLIKHRNLVSCVGYCAQPTSHHRTAISEVLIIMPYYKKGSVFDEIETLMLRDAHMSEKRVVSHVRGICHALHALHTATPTALAHRDVKPHNVMIDVIDGEDVPVLMDFGSMGPARPQIKNRTEAAALQDLAAEKCTMPYRAPELFQIDTSSAISEKVDIWSLGCTMYAMCFNESPFDKVHQRGDSIALAAMAGNIKIPDKHSYTDGLISVMMKMLSVSSQQRPTANEVLHTLTHIYSTDTTDSGPITSNATQGQRGASNGTVGNKSDDNGLTLTEVDLNNVA